MSQNSPQPVEFREPAFPGNIDALQTIATTPPKDMSKIARTLSEHGSLTRYANFHNALGGVEVVPPKPLNDEEKTLKQTIEAYDNELASQMAWRALATGALLGISLSAAFTGLVGAAKYNIRDNNDMLPKGRVEGQLFENNTLTAEMIPLGNTGVSIPYITYGELRTQKIAVVSEHTATASTTSQLSKNPFAADLKLTGQEFALNRQAVEGLLDKIEAREGTITSARVKGIASDDFGGRLGEENPEQIDLAKARTDEAVAALVEVAAERDVKLPPEIITESYESVLSDEEVKRVERTIDENGMSLPDALQKYNTGQQTPVDISTALDELIIRGSEYAIDYQTTVENNEVKLVPAGNKTDTVSPYAVFGLALPATGLLAGVAQMLADNLRFPQRRQKAAKKTLKQLKRRHNK